MITPNKQKQSTATFKALAFILLSLLTACNKQPQAPTAIQGQETANSPSPSNTAKPDKVWPLGASILNEAALTAETFNAHLDELLASPSAEALKLTQDAWRKTTTNIEHFYTLSRLGIAETKEFGALLEEQFNMGAWPIQPGYLDAYGEHIYSGIIFDIGSQIDEKTLRSQHGFTDNADAVLGVYAIEYLLFGEKNQRSFLMFQEITALSQKKVEDGYQSKEELPRNRRRELLRLQSKLLTQDIAQLRTKWSSKHPNGLSARFQNHSKESQHMLLMRVTQSTITEQILAIAKQQKNAKVQSNDFNIWKSQQLASRISAQLEGLAKLMGASQDATLQNIKEPSKKCITITKSVIHTTPPAQKANTPSAGWKDVYNCVRGLARKLESPQEK